MRRRIKVGDRIKFKAATRDSYRIAIRVVRSFDNQGRPLVGVTRAGEISSCIATRLSRF